MPQIMVVDDSRTQRTVISEYLKPLQADIVLLESGQEAINALPSGVPDLIILDVEMPGLSGFETCKAIRGFLQDNWIPIIYLTAHTDSTNLVEGLKVGGDTYIHKPVQADVLQAITKAMLRLSAMQAELLEANKKLNDLAHFDVLTQIMNRRGYEDMLTRLWSSHKRQQQPLSLMLMDIDFFKKYNDNYGHIQGDECLRNVAQALKGALKRPIDVLARYGGEEFVVLLPNTDLEGAKAVAENFIQAMANANIPHEYSDAAGHVTLSIGINEASNEETSSNLLTKADEALYAAKEQGRNCFVCYSVSS
jgi:diguanylate cyclase (GGDEF)-like protein